VFEHRVLREIFGPKRDEVTGEWKRLYNEELYGVYSSTNIILVMKSRTRWAHMGGRRGAYRVLVGKPEIRRPIGRSGRRLEDNIKMDNEEMGMGGMDWICLAQDKERWRALVNAVMNLQVP
jgi:hypothetical protein